MEIMKKYFMTLAAVLCCAMIVTAFTSCNKDENDVRTYSYTITFDNYFYSSHESLDFDNPPSDGGFSSWMNSILGAYKNSLGVSSDTFTLNGTQSECDAKVYEACKKAEETVKNIKGGSATVAVTNTTAGKKVYSYTVQP